MPILLNSVSNFQYQMAGPGPSNPPVQQNLEDTIGLMRENINKISQRGERLDSLGYKSANLAVSAQGFRGSASEKRREMWRKRMKLSFCLVGGILVIVAIVLSILGIFKKI